MTTKEQAAMQHALKDICAAKLCEVNSMSSRQEMLRLMNKAITALQEALAEPDIEEMTLTQIAARHEQAEQEPVAYVYEKDVAGLGMRKDVAFLKNVEVGTDLYAAPVQQAEQEPVACPDKGLWTVKQWGTDKVVLLSNDFTHDVGLTISGDFLDIEQRLDYALNLAAWMNHHLQSAALVRTKDLTDDEIYECYTSDAHENTPRSFARAVIAADREKNKCQPQS